MLNALPRMGVRVVDVETRPRFALSAKRRDCRRQRSGVSRTSSAIVRASNTKSALMQPPERPKASARTYQDSHRDGVRRSKAEATNSCRVGGQPMSSWQTHATDMYARFWLKRRLQAKGFARARAILSGGALPIPPCAAFRLGGMGDPRPVLNWICARWRLFPGLRARIAR